MNEQQSVSPVPLADAPVTNPPPQEPEPATPPVSETVVIPANPENPFIPQSSSDTGRSVVPPQSGGSSFVKRLFTILVFLTLFGAVGTAGWYGWQMMQGEKSVTIIYWGLWENESVIAPIIEEYSRTNPKVTVQYVKQSPKQYRERLEAAVVRGDGPDVFRFHNTWVPMLIDELSPVPETVMSAALFSDTFYPVAANDLVAGSRIYGLPLMIDGLGLYYNEDMFVSAGVFPPTTWEDVLNLVPKLTVKSGTDITTSAIALGTVNNVEHASDILATMMMQNGVNLAEPTGSQAEEALIFYRKFADPNDPVYSWSESLDNSVVAFSNGRVSMILAPSWRAFDIKVLNANLRFKVIPIPQLPGNNVAWASYWVEGVSAKSRYPKQAWDFVSFLTSRESAVKLYTEESKLRLFGEPYARVELGESLSSDPYVGAYINQASYARSFPLASRTFDNGINDRLITYLTDAVNGMKDGGAPSAVLSTMQSGFSQVLKSYGLVSASASK